MLYEGIVKHNGEFYHYIADASFSRDANYGADADGNRGVEVQFLDRFIVSSVENEQGDNVTEVMIDDDNFLDKVEESIYAIAF